MESSSVKIAAIEEAYAHLSIEEEEEGGLILEDVADGSNDIDFHCYLVGRFLTDRPINLMAMDREYFGFHMETCKRGMY